MLSPYRYYLARKNPHSAFYSLLIFWVIAMLFLAYVYLRPSPFRYINEDVLSNYCHVTSDLSYSEKIDWDNFFRIFGSTANETKRLEVKEKDLIMMESKVFIDPGPGFLMRYPLKFDIDFMRRQQAPVIVFDESWAYSLFTINGDLYEIVASQDLCAPEQLEKLAQYWYSKVK